MPEEVKRTIMVTPDELAALDKLPKDAFEGFERGKPIERTRQKVIAQAVSVIPMEVIEFDFCSEQLARGNSKATIAYYKRCFKKLYIFFAYQIMSDTDFEKYKDDDEAMSKFGRGCPGSTLEMDDLVADYREFLVEQENCNEQTVNSYLRGLKALVNYCAEKGYIKPYKIVIRDSEAPIRDTYTDEELQILLRKPSDIDNFAEYRDWVITNYFVGTGNRVASVAALKVGDIDFVNETVTVTHQKNRVPLTVSIPARLVRILREYVLYWRCDEDGKPMMNEALFCNKYDYNIKRGVKKTSCHLYRHTYAKRWILEGKDIIQLAKVLNHKNLKMVQRYANLWGTDLKPAVEEASLLNLVKRKSGETLQKRKKLERRGK